MTKNFKIIITIVIILVIIGAVVCLHKYKHDEIFSHFSKSNTEKKDNEKTNQDIKKGKITKEILKIKSQKVDCVGSHPTKCLIANGEFFYDTIEGFDFEKGYTYEIEVEKNQFCDPNILNDCPQDVGIYKYKLLKVLKKEKWPDFEKLTWANPNSQKLDVFMKDFYKKQEITDGVYRTAPVDLNGDKKNELIVMLEVDELCGTGGCQMIILKETDKTYDIISENKEMFGPVQGVAISENKTGNWNDLYTLFADGGSTETYGVLKYENGFYKMVVDEKNTEVVNIESNDFVKNCQKENGIIVGPNKSLQCAKNGKINFEDNRESIDISKCKSYNDGCNTFFVNNGKISAGTLMYREEEVQKPTCLKN